MRYSITHNAADNDLSVRIGADLDYDPGTLGGADFEVLGLGESQPDSAVVQFPTPANTGTSAAGTIRHYWSIGFNEGDGAEPYLAPSAARPWFLRVLDGGFVNRTGRIESFSIFVNDSPGSATGTTYVTDHSPMPQPLTEGGAVPATVWIPEEAVIVDAPNTSRPLLTFASALRPNPVAGAGAVLEYVIGTDAAPSGRVDVEISVFDLQGRQVQSILRPDEAVGRYRVQWNGTDHAGRRVAPGVYQLRFAAGTKQQAQRIVVLK